MLGRVTRGIVLSTSMLMSGAVWAQSTPAAAGAAEPTSNTAAAAGAQDIIVTAQRRSENLQVVPVAIAAVSGNQLAAAGVSDLEGLRQLVPGLIFNSIQMNVQPRLRGIGSSSAGPGIEPEVAIYVDGVYYASATGALFKFNNVEQVSVLKGPQGTLFGRNAVAGLVQVTTRTPNQDFKLEANAGYGNYQTGTGSFYVAGGLAPNLAMDFAGSALFQGEGYGRNLTVNQDTKKTNHDLNFRSKLVFTPGPDTKITLAGDYSNTDGTQGTIRVEKGTTPAPGTGPNFGGSVWDVTGDVAGYNRVAGGGGNLKIEQKLGDVNLLSITAYRKLAYNNSLDLDATGTPNQGIVQHQDDRQFSQEFQAQSAGRGPFKWTVGVFYFSANDASDPLHVSLYGAAISPFFPLTDAITYGRQVTHSVAGYGQASYAFGSGTTLTVGGRYTYEKRDADTIQTLILQSPAPVIGPNESFQSATFKKPTFRVSLDQKLSPDAMIYASFNTGFKSGGFNAQQLNAPVFLPEELDAYEAGFKTKVFDGRMTLNGSAFYYNYTNIQIQHINADGSLGILNGAKARAYGLDLDFAARIVGGLQLNGGLEALSTKFLSFPMAPISSASGGIAVTVGPATGNQLPIAPNFSASLGGSYKHDMADGSAITLNVSGQYNAGWYTEPDNLFRQRQFAQLAGSLRWNSPGNHYYASIWADNITNAEVRSNAGTLANGTKFASFAPPRTYGLTLGYKY